MLYIDKQRSVEEHCVESDDCCALESSTEDVYIWSQLKQIVHDPGIDIGHIEELS